MSLNTVKENLFQAPRFLISSSIGIGHDGAQSCPDGINIMATGTIGGEGSYKWSSCSKNALQQYLGLV